MCIVYMSGVVYICSVCLACMYVCMYMCVVCYVLGHVCVVCREGKDGSGMTKVLAPQQDTG